MNSPTAIPSSSAKKRPLSLYRVRTAWIFLMPALLVLLAVTGWPFVRTFYFSLTNAHLSDLSELQFDGFQNFLFLFEDPNWWEAVWNTLLFASVSVSLETLLGLGVALVLNMHFKGRNFVRAAVLIPWAIPTVVSARMWSWMYHDIYGILNSVGVKLGLLASPVAWAAHPDLSLWSVVLVDVWKTTPFMALLLLAGLQTIPKDCYEAAKVDGINPLRVFYRVTLPLLMPAILVAMIFRTLDALRVFDVIYILTGTNYDTMSMSIYARQQLFDFQNIGTGSAASVLLFIL
ncbi:MAG: sugar ABC transporter permease, partial [Alphaproteobacteria bacterium]|nr:sugar ABC transporter permease [Alphaproteobacteria bacterium]